MARQHKVTFNEVAERYFTCERCGATGAVEYHVKGDGGWVREGLLDDGSDAQERSAQNAAADMMVDSDRVLGLITCPSCKLRRPGAFTGWYFRIGLPLVLGVLALPAIGGENGLLVGGCFAALAIWMLIREVGRLRRASYAVITKLQKGTKVVEANKPKDKPAPKAALPKAIATQVPPAIAPVIPVRTSAPEITQPRGPDEGPAFLRDGK